MSEYIQDIKAQKEIEAKDGNKYTLYWYELTSGDTVTSFTKYKVGDRVEHFWSKKYDAPRIRLYKERRKNEQQ